MAVNVLSRGTILPLPEVSTYILPWKLEIHGKEMVVSCGDWLWVC